jgi:hypothetical protein
LLPRHRDAPSSCMLPTRHRRAGRVVVRAIASLSLWSGMRSPASIMFWQNRRVRLCGGRQRRWDEAKLIQKSGNSRCRPERRFQHSCPSGLPATRRNARQAGGMALWFYPTTRDHQQVTSAPARRASFAPPTIVITEGPGASVPGRRTTKSLAAIHDPVQSPRFT